ncbi:MAG: hypothetical protein LUG18_02820 [Candidatus Azobacteroides sp.]|nr:hypothetical protein [Candidatus Azobacteroides sp.]
MKTNFLLFVFASLLATSIGAQNLIQNGDFEEDYFTTFEFDGRIVPSLIPGWDKVVRVDGGDLDDDFNNEFAINKWNVFPILEDSFGGEYARDFYDGAYIDDDNYYCLVLKRYEWNGWGDAGLQQTVAIEAGETYDFSFIWAGKWTELRRNNDDWAGTLSRFVRIYEDRVDDATLIYEIEMDPELQFTPWEEVKTEIRASNAANTFIIRLGMNGHGGSDSDNGQGGNIDVVTLFDNVSLSPKNGNNINDITKSNISLQKFGTQLIIKNAAMGSTVSLYGITGKQIVADLVDAEDYRFSVAGFVSGVYILKVGNESFKIIL